MTLLENTSQFWKNPNLKNIGIIAAQHVMESVLALFTELKNNGLDPKKTFIMGKCYSTSVEVMNEFLLDGFQVHKFSTKFDSHQPFDLQYENYLQAFVKEAIAELIQHDLEKIIIIDDGGHLIKILQQYSLPFEVVSIEQTSAGINFLKEVQLEIPVINVARSSAKLLLETPFIIESSLKRLFSLINQKTMKNKNLLVMGKGVIGRCVGTALEKIGSVAYYDTQNNSSYQLSSLIEQAEYIFGCTGVTSIKYDLYRKRRRKPLNLISLSSSDREFDSYCIRKNFSQTESIHQDYQLENILLINSGFPINFWGSRNNMEMKKIELTMCLLLGAVYQGLKVPRVFPGIVGLDQNFENHLIDLFVNMNSYLFDNEKKQVEHPNQYEEKNAQYVK